MNHQELMVEVAELFDAGHGYRSVASLLNVSSNTSMKWEYAYRALGKEALLSRTHKSYSQELKIEAVQLVIDKGLTKVQVMQRLGIRSKTALDRWVRDYRREGVEALAPKPRGRKPKPAQVVYATREEELEARVQELELELEIQKRINALADEIEQKRHRC